MDTSTNQTTDKHIKVLKVVLAAERFKVDHGKGDERVVEALTAVLADFRDMREMIEAADAIQFGNVRFVRRAGYCWISNEGDETVSLFDAYKLLKKQKQDE